MRGLWEAESEDSSALGIESSQQMSKPGVYPSVEDAGSLLGQKKRVIIRRQTSDEDTLLLSSCP